MARLLGNEERVEGLIAEQIAFYRADAIAPSGEVRSGEHRRTETYLSLRYSFEVGISSTA